MDKDIEIMVKNTNCYWHNDRVIYMLSRIVRGKDINCKGLGYLVQSIAQESIYKCELCGKFFTTEGE